VPTHNPARACELSTPLYSLTSTSLFHNSENGAHERALSWWRALSESSDTNALAVRPQLLVSDLGSPKISAPCNPYLFYDGRFSGRLTDSIKLYWFNSSLRNQKNVSTCTWVIQTRQWAPHLVHWPVPNWQLTSQLLW
jgi:hypothetical protein